MALLLQSDGYARDINSDTKTIKVYTSSRLELTNLDGFTLFRLYLLYGLIEIKKFKKSAHKTGI